MLADMWTESDFSFEGKIAKLGNIWTINDFKTNDRGFSQLQN